MGTAGAFIATLMNLGFAGGGAPTATGGGMQAAQLRSPGMDEAQLRSPGMEAAQLRSPGLDEAQMR